MGRITARRPVVRIRGEHRVDRPDTLVVEEPMELRVDGRALAVTMRTPGHDVELAHGFLLTEGVIASRADIAAARYCDGVDDEGANTYNVLDVTLAPGVAAPETGVERNFYTTSSCGVCGKGSLDAIRLRTKHSPADDDVVVTSDTLAGLPDTLRAAQKVFDTTGGLHAAALFTADGDMLVLREDVGRHNAVDKVVGWATEHDRVPLRGTILMVSGRASFELAQKAVMAGIPILAAVSAPSSLAVDLATESGLTVIGFLRGRSMNIYSRADRVLVSDGIF
ncbi:formate dehydrogenase accessory sulfurtransferase FdhD [Rhodococcus fascians]|jgi:FdhD protein|nr:MULTISPECIES: formate dehydrogenase accessory sulfurtransferase FdhD [Rhodococcus]MSX05091.1 formate dehydrogenase accessory sulfurtransferase FdhD [Actinomycetota bacterium]MBJ7323840.1 formate dehydrogenase accessory sulfurtransferase FdhD [Rhodococcus sp. (in: high G+C Gram-positive bacteria)]MBW4780972.1 formate dehydrogenase accessory sulfurtransferase FdhD [Rhodococcus fascians]MDJ0003267.1 formate dehydrogenase accessory sulfurtransferase FdhD [Rhodococcus fascians]MDJ0424947.1 forma